jgi:hypothetical protein
VREAVTASIHKVRVSESPTRGPGPASAVPAAAGFPVLRGDDELPGLRRFDTHDVHGNRLKFLAPPRTLDEKGGDVSSPSVLPARRAFS